MMLFTHFNFSMLLFIFYFCSAHALPEPIQASYTLATPRTATPSSWRWLCDSIIDIVWKAWSRPDVPADTFISYNGRDRQPSAPSSLVSQHGGDIVVRFQPSTPAEAAALKEACDVLFLDVWSTHEDWVDIRLAEKLMVNLMGLLPDSLHSAWHPLMRGHDLVYAIHDTFPSSSTTGSRSLRQQLSSQNRGSAYIPQARGSLAQSSQSSAIFADYQPLSVLNAWMHQMQRLHPQVTVLTIGKSHEGRDIFGLQIDNDVSANTILITGGTSARDWLSVATTAHLANDILTTCPPPFSAPLDHHSNSPLCTQNYILIPTLNPDGYHHTFHTDRLWHKNRQPTSSRFCRGLDIDLSRIFPSPSSPLTTPSSSASSPCSNSHPGASPLAATEAASLSSWAANATLSHNLQLAAHLDLRSYGQRVRYIPSCDPAQSDAEASELAQGIATAMSASAHPNKKIEDEEEEQVVVEVMEERSSAGERYDAAPLEWCRVAIGGDGARVADVGAGGADAVQMEKQELRRGRHRRRAAQDERRDDSEAGVVDGSGRGLGLGAIRHVFRLELRDKGTYGVLVPREQIGPSGREVRRGVEHLAGRLPNA